jgi:uncharacterized protein involved in outer membrane biogenesis
VNKKIKISIAVFSLILIVLIALPFAINKSAIKFQVEQKISQKLGVKFEAKGSIAIRFLPIPQISLGEATANNIVISNELYSNISVKNLIIRPEILSLFSGKMKIKSLIFQNPKIENRYINAIQTISTQKEGEAPKVINMNGGLFNKMVDLKNSDKEIFDFKNIKSIKFSDGSFSAKNNDNDISTEFTKINFTLKNQLKKQIFIIQGDFLSGNIPTDFKLVANIQNNDDSILTIQSPIINFIASGKFENSNIQDLIKSNFSGKIDAEIINLKALLNKYFSKNNPIYLKINATQPIIISANINDNNGKITIEDILIKSQIIAGNGKIIANFANEKPKIDANFTFENIDMDNIWSAAPSGTNNKVIESQNDIIKKFISDSQVDVSNENKSRIIDVANQPSSKKSILDNLDFNADIRIKTAQYYGGTLGDLKLYFLTSGNGKITLAPFTADIPGGSLKVGGTIEYENNIPKFIGKALIIGQDLSKSLSWLKIDIDNLKPNILSQYNFSTDLIYMPNLTFFNNLILAANDDKNIVIGDLKIDNSTNISKSSASLRINYLNYDDYFSPPKHNPYLSTGPLLNKLLWLNTINSHRNIYLLFNQLVYRGETLENQSFRAQFGQGYFKLSDIDIHSPTIDIKGDIDVDITNNSPQFNININSNNFQYNLEDSTGKNQLFSLPSLDDFSGKVNFNVGNLKLKSWQASDIKIAGKLKNGVIDFNNFNFQTYAGTAKYKGSMVCKNIKTVNGSLELLGVDNTQFLSNIFGVNNISGVANISSVINAGGETEAEFIKNINAKVQFISAKVTVTGFGVYDLAIKMAQPTKYRDELVQPLRILYKDTTQSTFDNAAGAADFKRGSKNVFYIKTSTTGINGIVSGAIDNKNSFDASGNFIFISGTRQNQIPINFAVNFNGQSGNINQSTNLNQVEQYLGLPISSPVSIKEPEAVKIPDNDNQPPIY